MADRPGKKIKDEYMMDSHKLLWHLDRVCQWQQGKRIAPLHLDIGITTGCNMGCVYCYGVLQGRDMANQRFNMPKDALLRLLKDAKDIGVRSIAFIGEGENTLNDALYDGLSFAKEIDLDVSIATNGIKIPRERLQDMMEALKWMRFNISAATRDSYYNIHKIKAYDRVVNNIQAAVELKRKHKMEIAIGLQMVVVRDNISDIVPLARLGKKLGVDYLVVKPCSDTYDGTMSTPHEKYLEIEDIMQEAECFSDESYTVSVKWRKMKNLGRKGFEMCYGTSFLLQISGDGTVFPCGHFFNIRRDEFTMGNIIDASLKEVVKSERYWNVHKKIQCVNVNRDCETNCRHYYISQFLWDLKNPPRHVNFI
ncbi:MAG: Radical SAM protein [Candidatus Scalindua rubra]|uniref:Radical SAM protein n=1 Tax=Candidatus Scalindua rubra TaxID=1872076 RepID=A0A1E3X3F2_9BACT|nr:MAG: Radical SAM protein [Candidatus Scalindua rubra]